MTSKKDRERILGLDRQATAPAGRALVRLPQARRADPLLDLRPASWPGGQPACTPEALLVPYATEELPRAPHPMARCFGLRAPS